MTTIVSTRIARRAAGTLLLCLAAAAQAQSVYRIVGADGKVTFSDKPPLQAPAKVVGGLSGSGAATASPLPYELRQLASKYPVTLYSSDNCSPCIAARSLLVARGVPFTEKTVKSADDIQALQRLSGEASLPFGTIGGQQLKGFSDIEWTQFLNAAGYPAASALPAGYQSPPPTPLVAAVPAAGNAGAADVGSPGNRTPSRTSASPAPATPANKGNPNGIKF